MDTTRFDVLVVGAGPGGSIAALEAARGGARVALVDKAAFPRDKACGDLVGPRGVRLLDEMGIEIPGGLDVGDMLVVGPTGRRVHLPARPGETYPGYGTVFARRAFDAVLRERAVEAGATPFVGRAGQPVWEDDRLAGFRLDTGEALRADFVIGADGATSHVAAAAGMVLPGRTLWGFAVRSYVQGSVPLPTILLWDLRPWRAFPGYGWIFPGPDGVTNVGLGVAVKGERSRGSEAVRLLPRFRSHLEQIGLLRRDGPRPERQLGGWLKLGMVGTTPAKDRVMLVGDAAGLVNPLQGEGIAHALTSGRAAAAAVLRSPGCASERYRAFVAASHLPYFPITASAHAALLGHPRAVAAAGRLLTLPGLGRTLAGGWAVFWNELLDGAPPSSARRLAQLATFLGARLTSRGDVARWFEGALSERPPERRQHR